MLKNFPKTRTYLQLDKFVDHIKIYQNEMVSSRIPKYEATYIARQRRKLEAERKEEI